MMDKPQCIGINCAALAEFLFLLRVGELASLRWIDASLSIHNDGDACLQLTFPRSQTDQYNEGHVKVMNGTNHPCARSAAWRDGWASSQARVWRMAL